MTAESRKMEETSEELQQKNEKLNAQLERETARAEKAAGWAVSAILVKQVPKIHQILSDRFYLPLYDFISPHINLTSVVLVVVSLYDFVCFVWGFSVLGPLVTKVFIFQPFQRKSQTQFAMV